MKTFMEYWVSVAADLLAQALAGEPELSESLPKPFESGSFGFAATLAGDEEGRFSVVLDRQILETPLMGEGVDARDYPCGCRGVAGQVREELPCGEI
jgi:hypothetical protein